MNDMREFGGVRPDVRALMALVPDVTTRSLPTLPNEVLDRITSFVPNNGCLLALALTSRGMHEYSRRAMSWDVEGADRIVGFTRLLEESPFLSQHVRYLYVNIKAVKAGDDEATELYLPRLLRLVPSLHALIITPTPTQSLTLYQGTLMAISQMSRLEDLSLLPDQVPNPDNYLPFDGFAFVLRSFRSLKSLDVHVIYPATTTDYTPPLTPCPVRRLQLDVMNSTDSRLMELAQATFTNVDTLDLRLEQNYDAVLPAMTADGIAAALSSGMGKHVRQLRVWRPSATIGSYMDRLIPSLQHLTFLALDLPAETIEILDHLPLLNSLQLILRFPSHMHASAFAAASVRCVAFSHQLADKGRKRTLGRIGDVSLIGPSGETWSESAMDAMDGALDPLRHLGIRVRVNKNVW
jgi:hypothetical protein